MATPNLSYQNKFSTTLSSGIVAGDTTIPLTALPTPSEGYLILEPDSSTAWEEIYYTSKTGSAVVCPSAAAGRGVGGSTAASHSSGATVRMDSSAELFSTLQDATALTGVHTNNSNYAFDFVSSGCVWTGDSLGSTRAASMTSGVVYINGRKHTVVAVTSRTFTASKDTYIDLLYSTVDNIATPVYAETTNNAASPALAANSVRIGIIVTGATTIAAAGSVNQGQETMVLPIASSVPYAVTDSLGNLICPRDPNRKILGYRQIIANQDAGTNVLTDVTALSMPIIVPANRKVKLSGIGGVFMSGTGRTVSMYLREGSTQLQISDEYSAGANTPTVCRPEYIGSPSTGAHTYKASIICASGANVSIQGATNAPSYIMAELV